MTLKYCVTDCIIESIKYDKRATCHDKAVF